jgi:small-conductance mechanosensitive channel
VADLSARVQNSLDENRMLILGAQVLVGFGYQAVMQPGFDRLPAQLQYLKLVGLALMLIAIGLLIAPGAFHQIVERGNDTERLLGFASRVATVALLPFALSIGVDVFLSAFAIVGPVTAIVGGAAAALFALFFWYGLEWLVRSRVHSHRSHHPMPETPEKTHTPLSQKIRQVLTEARVVLPGAQALLGFQFAAILMDAFAKLSKELQVLHLVSLGLIAASIVFLMAPAAFHRLVENGEDSERMHRFASAMVLCAMVPLALGIAADFYVVLAKVLASDLVPAVVAGVTLVFFFGLWFGLTLAVRARDERREGRASARELTPTRAT